MEAWVAAVVKELSIEDLPPVYQDIARISSVEVAVKISEKWGGLSCYFQQLDAILRKKRDEAILREFKERKWASSSEAQRTLAIKYSLTEVWVREIINRVVPKQEVLL